MRVRLSRSGGWVGVVFAASMVSMASGVALLSCPQGGRADDRAALMQQLGDGGDIMAQLERELGGLLGGGSPSGFVYVNDQGQRVEVSSREQVPAQFRDSAQAVYPGKQEAAPTRPPGPAEFYKYKDHNGREVYTNIVEQIPVEEREAARLDLSHITLNSELGTEIQHRLEAAHGKLVDSAYCQDVRAHARERALKDIWEEYAPLIICGVVLLLFVLGSPFMVRSVGGPAWSRTLMFALPALAFAGFMMYSMTSTNRAILRFKHAQSQEQSCEQGALQGAASEGGVDVLGKQLNLIKKMQQNMHSHIKGLTQLEGAVSPGVDR